MDPLLTTRLDHTNHRIQVFDREGNFIRLFGKGGVGNKEDGALMYPFAVAVDREGTVVVSDAGNYRMQIFSSEGKYLQKFGSYGGGEGQFACPFGMVIDREGNIVVVEQANNRVQIFGE